MPLTSPWDASLNGYAFRPLQGQRPNFFTYQKIKSVRSLGDATGQAVSTAVEWGVQEAT